MHTHNALKSSILYISQIVRPNIRSLGSLRLASANKFDNLSTVTFEQGSLNQNASKKNYRKIAETSVSLAYLALPVYHR